MLYFEEPDTTAHAFGPESAQVLSCIQMVGMSVLEITFSFPINYRHFPLIIQGNEPSGSIKGKEFLH
jgi:hypothetical protein